jgi:hypothetical protein
MGQATAEKKLRERMIPGIMFGISYAREQQAVLSADSRLSIRFPILLFRTKYLRVEYPRACLAMLVSQIAKTQSKEQVLLKRTAVF